MRVRPTLTERFWRKVRRMPNGCWRWTGALDTRPEDHIKGRAGYGRFQVKVGHVMLAHRFAYELLVGPIPEGLQIDHLCRHPWCVNPSHLEPVTGLVNNQRAEPYRNRPRKAECSRGHVWTDATTRLDPRGSRHCRACDRENTLARSERRAAARQLVPTA